MNSVTPFDDAEQDDGEEGGVHDAGLEHIPTRVANEVSRGRIKRKKKTGERYGGGGGGAGPWGHTEREGVFRGGGGVCFSRTPQDEAQDDGADDVDAVAAAIEAAFARSARARARGGAVGEAQWLSRLRHRGTAGGDQRDGGDRGQIFCAHNDLPWLARIGPWRTASRRTFARLPTQLPNVFRRFTPRRLPRPLKAGVNFLKTKKEIRHRRGRCVLTEGKLGTLR